MVVIDLTRKRKARSCPVCGVLADQKFVPFCSSRCADLDLGKWLNGVYSVPVVNLDEGDLEELQATVEDGDGFSEKDY